jgi:hypothetical protein
MWIRQHQPSMLGEKFCYYGHSPLAFSAFQHHLLVLLCKIAPPQDVFSSSILSIGVPFILYDRLYLFDFFPLAGTLGVGSLIAEVDGDGSEEVRNGGVTAWRRSAPEKISSWLLHQVTNHFYRSFFLFWRDQCCPLFDRALQNLSPCDLLSLALTF